MNVKEAEAILPIKLIEDLKKNMKEFKLTSSQKQKVLKLKLKRQSGNLESILEQKITKIPSEARLSL